MFTRKTILALTLLVATSALPASAQDTWRPFASGFAGGSAIPAFSVDVVDQTTASKFDVRDRKIINAVVGGGSFGVWRQIDGRRLRWGMRGEVLRQRIKANPQMIPANGTLFGAPYSGLLPVPDAKGNATIVTGAFLLGWSGRVVPYVGVGGGFDRVTGKIGGIESTDTGGMYQALAGLEIGLGHRVSMFAEYRFSSITQTLFLGTQRNDFSTKPNQIVAGLTLGLR